ncbi:PAS domain S-box protein [Bacteroidota bacterium]
MSGEKMNSNDLSVFAPTGEIRALLEHSDRSIIILDPEFRILWFNSKANREMHNFYGQTLKANVSYWDYVEREENQRFVKNFESALKGRTISTEQKISRQTANQRELWIEGRFSPLSNNEGNCTGVIYSYVNITDRKKTELETLGQQNVLRAINHNDSQGFILLSEDDRILNCNLLAPKLFTNNEDHGNCSDMDITSCIFPSWQASFKSGLKIARNGGNASVEFEQPGPDKRIIEVRFNSVTDRLGEKNLVSIWATDITKKKQTEEEVRKSERNLKSVFNSSSQTFFLINRDFTIEAFNEAARIKVKKRAGIDLKPGAKLTDISKSENQIQLRVEIERAFSGKHVSVEKYFNIDGEDIWYERHLNPIVSKQGTIDQITIWSKDITVRKIAEKALKDSESKFKKLTALLPVGIYQSDPNGHVTYINDSLKNILDIDTSTIINGKWAERIHKDDIKKVISTWKAVEKERKPFYLEYRVKSSSGKTVYVMQKAQPLINQVGEYTGYLGTIIDITEQRRSIKLMQAKLVADKSLKFKSDFLANMSHEIRTPLNGILGMSEILLETELNADQKSKINNIITVSQDLKSIVNDVLDLSKLEAGKVVLNPEEFELLDLLSLVEQRFRFEARKKGLSIIVKNEVGKATLHSDRRRITQVLSNLLSNALKFTKKGSITIKVSRCKDNDQLRFEVIDTGYGIPASESKKLFKDFSQLKHTTAQDLEGTGLGLSISKKIIKLLKGDIGVKSTINVGSTFWFTIPQQIQGAKTIVKKAVVKNLAIKKNLSVLLVEDNLINQQAFKIMLQKMGCTVKVFSNGKQAVENFAENTYDIVFMDIQMPEMDGLQATAKIKNQYKSVPPVIGLSGNVLQRDEQGNIQSDMDDLLMKPVVSQDILKMISKWTN